MFCIHQVVIALVLLVPACMAQGTSGSEERSRDSNGAAQNEDVAVVVNQGNRVSNVSEDELRKIFAGERTTWPGGLLIKVIVRAPVAHERAVLLKLLGMSEAEFKQHQDLLVHEGLAQAGPVAVFSNGMAKEAIAAIPGAIALMDARDVRSPMRVIKINGRMPGQSNYPLH